MKKWHKIIQKNGVQTKKKRRKNFNNWHEFKKRHINLKNQKLPKNKNK